jgi:hypothetical protein
LYRREGNSFVWRVFWVCHEWSKLDCDFIGSNVRSYESLADNQCGLDPWFRGKPNLVFIRYALTTEYPIYSGRKAGLEVSITFIALHYFSSKIPGWRRRRSNPNLIYSRHRGTLITQWTLELKNRKVGKYLPFYCGCVDSRRKITLNVKANELILSTPSLCPKIRNRPHKCHIVQEAKSIWSRIPGEESASWKIVKNTKKKIQVILNCRTWSLRGSNSRPWRY